MNLQCKQCSKPFIKGLKENNKLFCTKECQQEYWKIKRNKTGVSRKESRQAANYARQYLRLSEKQLQLCVGALLGDSSMTPRSNGSIRMRFGHVEKHKDYLEWKRNLMNQFIVQKTPSNYISKGLSISSMFVYETIQHEDFKRLYLLFYSPSRKKRLRNITWKTLDLLTPFSVLIWYLDDGTLIYPLSNKGRNPSATIRTDDYPLPVQRMLKRWFWQKHQIDIKITYDKTHNSYYLRFNTKQVDQLMNLFKPYIHEIPSCMQYKIKQPALPADNLSTKDF